MRIFGTFKDKNENTWSIYFYNKNNSGTSINIDESDDVRIGADAVHITTETDDVFEHIIRRSCTINLITKRWLGEELFADNAESVGVNVFREDECIFSGFVSPNTYSQDYSHEWEELTINCIDYLSVLQYKFLTDGKSYDALKDMANVYNFKWYLEQMKLNNTSLHLLSYPINDGEKIWVETDYTINGTSTYTITETQVVLLDENVAMKTQNTRTGETRDLEWVQSEDTMIVNGILYYVEYAYVTVNGNSIKTDLSRQSSTAAQPEEIEGTRYFVATGVVRTGVNQYYKYGEWHAQFTDNKDVVVGDGIDTDSGTLSYDLVHSSIDNIVYVDNVAHWLDYPHVKLVTYIDTGTSMVSHTEHFYFSEDAEIGDALGTHTIEGKCDGESFTIKVNYNTSNNTYQSSTPTISTIPDENGEYYFYLDISKLASCAHMFENNLNITGIAYIKEIGDTEFTYMYYGCKNLRNGYVHCQEVFKANYAFANCYSLETLIYNCAYPSQYKTNIFTEVPITLIIYVPDESEQFFSEDTTFNNYIIKTLTTLYGNTI